MGDADESYDFSHLSIFLKKLREGHDLVMGNRFLGGIAPGAMPFLHRYLGNPVLSAIGKLFFGCSSNDFHCGLRAFRRDAVRKLKLHTLGMEFASEMVVKATLFGFRVAEVPTTLKPDGRSHPPHLRTWRDGWRHLRFLLLYSPRWLFLYPGMLLMLGGIAGSVWLLPGPGPDRPCDFRRAYASVRGYGDFHWFWVRGLNFAMYTKILALPPKASCLRISGSHDYFK